MNCYEIASILDDGDTGRLDERTRIAVGAHLDTCAECARHWNLHARLAARALPPMPQELAEACRTLVQAGPAVGGRARARSRFILIGTLAAVAAAAAMLLLSLRDRPVTAYVPAPAAVEETTAAATTEVLVEEVVPVEAVDPVPAPAATTTEGYSVLILPLEARTEDPAIIAAVRQFQQKSVEALRTLSGVTVMESPGGKEPNYALLFAALDPMPSDRTGMGRYQVTTYVPRSSRTKEQLAAYTPELLRSQGMRVDAFPGFVPAFSYNSIVLTAEACQGNFCPAEAVRGAINSLRMNAFRHDMAMQREVVARLLDPGLDPALRQGAISDLNAMISTGRAPKLDADLVRGLLNLHAGTADAQQRARLWTSLAGWKDPGLIAPMAELARTEGDEQVRASLVTRLAGNFGSDPAARKALQEISSSDASKLVRQVARRELLGEADWHQYVLDTVRDRDLSAQQRFEPIKYLLAQTGEVKNGKSLASWTLDQFDADTIGALAEALPAAWSDSDPGRATFSAAALNNRLQVNTVFTRLKHPALADLLLKGIEDGKPIARASLPAYLEKYMDEPRVLEALEKLRDDGDTRVREAAQKVLAKRESSTASAAQ